MVWHYMMYFVITKATFKLPLRTKGTISDLLNNISLFSKVNIWCLLRLTLIHILLQGKFCNNVTVFAITDNSFVINYRSSSTNQCCSRGSQRRGTGETAPVYYCWNISSSWVRSSKDFCARCFLTARNFSKLCNFLLVIIFSLCLILADSMDFFSQREYLMKKHNFCSLSNAT